MKLKFKFDPTTLIVSIIGLAVALLIFASIAPTVSTQLVASNFTSNATAGAIVPLITVVFIAGVIIAVIKGFLA